MSANIEHDFSKVVDIVRVIGTFAVILGHMASPFSSFIYSWHMPLFFFLSGLYLHKNVKYVPQLQKNFKRLLVPYFTFTILGLIAEIVKRLALHRPSIDISHQIIGIFYWMDYSHLNHYGFVLWFLPGLFVSKVFVESLERFLPIKPLIPVIICLIAFSFYALFGMTPLALTTGFMASVWLYSGVIFKRGLFSLGRDFNRIFVFSVAVFASLICYFFIPIAQMNFSELNFSSVVINYLYSLLIVLIIFAFAFVASFFQPLASVANIVAADCFLLFIAHPYTNNIGHIFSETYFSNAWYEKLLISLFLLFVIALSRRSLGLIRRVVYA